MFELAQTGGQDVRRDARDCGAQLAVAARALEERVDHEEGPAVTDAGQGPVERRRLHGCILPGGDGPLAVRVTCNLLVTGESWRCSVSMSCRGRRPRSPTGSGPPPSPSGATVGARGSCSPTARSSPTPTTCGTAPPRSPSPTGARPRARCSAPTRRATSSSSRSTPPGPRRPSGRRRPPLGQVVFAAARGRHGLRVSFGLVSGTGRSFRGPRGRRIAGSVEHTAPLARGSSGGPLVDAEGRLLGINTRRLGDGFYLAMPADAALRSVWTSSPPASRRSAAGSASPSPPRSSPGACAVPSACPSATACSCGASRTVRRPRPPGSRRATSSCPRAAATSAPRRPVGRARRARTADVVTSASCGASRSSPSR